jgi:hypothetical protein
MRINRELAGWADRPRLEEVMHAMPREVIDKIEVANDVVYVSTALSRTVVRYDWDGTAVPGGGA